MKQFSQKSLALIPALFFVVLVFGMPAVASAADRYWVGGTGIWDGADMTHWSDASGGAGGFSAPTSADNVFFDSSSSTANAAYTVTISAILFVTTDDLTVGGPGGGNQVTLAGSSQLHISGSLNLSGGTAGIINSYTGQITFDATSGVNTITSNGITYANTVTFDGVGGTWQLTDALVTSQNMNLYHGTFDANGANVSTIQFFSSNCATRGLTLGSGTWTLTGAAFGIKWYTACSAGLTLNSTGSTIVIGDTTSGEKDFYGGGLSYGTLTASGRNVHIKDSNTFTTLNVANAGLADGLVIDPGTTQTVTNFVTNGSVGNLAIISTGGAGTPFTLSKASGTVSVDYMDITDSTATGGANWYAGANSSDGGGNTGWIFTAAPTPLYFNNAVDSAWDTVGNWWTDASFTTPAGSIPTTGDAAYIGATLTAGPSVPVTLAHIYVADPSTGGGTFYVVLNGTTGDATFYDGSYQGSVVSSVVTGNAEFHDTSSNQYGGGYVTGNATFYDSSYNSYSVGGNAVFNDLSSNAGFVIQNATFNDSSQNNGSVYGNAFFYDTTTHTYSVSGDAFFDCSATNSGTVSGAITYGVSCPTIVSGALASDNTYIDVTVSEAVWGAPDATTVLSAGKFSAVFSQNAGNATNATILSITKTSGGVLDGSETVIRVNLSITGIPSGVETVAIKPFNGTSIYNTAADPMRPEQTTGAKTLNDQTVPATPIAAPVAGTYTGTQSITLSSAGSTTIRYTADGSTPTCLVGTLYGGAISVSTSLAIKAVGCNGPSIASPVGSFAYTINQPSGGGGGGGFFTGFTPSPTPSPTPTFTPMPLPQLPTRGDPANLARYSLNEGDVMGARPSGDPDVFIVNIWGYKRLFLNPVIFGFYGHLGGFSAVKSIVPFGRDAFPTSGLFRNCETRDPKVYALEVTGEDTGTLHWVNVSGEQAVAQDPDFFKKDFCINNSEFNWYLKSPVPYTSLSQMPIYRR